MPDNVLSIRPQLLCRKLVREIDNFLEDKPGATPQEMLGMCNDILTEIGALQDANGVWSFPEGKKGE